MSAAIIKRARSCFALASHPATGDGEREAALARGMALIEKYGLDPDLFDIPGRRIKFPHLRDHIDLAREEARAKAMKPVFGEVFGQCVGCGAVCSVGALCQACAWKAESLACEHGKHGFCLECEEIEAWQERRA